MRSVQVLDGEFKPLAAKEVTLVLANPAAGIEPMRRAGVHSGADGTWRIDDVRIPVAGRWNVRVEILINDFEKATVDDASLRDSMSAVRLRRDAAGRCAASRWLTPRTLDSAP